MGWPQRLNNIPWFVPSCFSAVLCHRHHPAWILHVARQLRAAQGDCVLPCPCPARGEDFSLLAIKQQSCAPCELEEMRSLSNSEPKSFRLAGCLPTLRGRWLGLCRWVRTGQWVADDGTDVEWRLGLGSREVCQLAPCPVVCED